MSLRRLTASSRRRDSGSILMVDRPPDDPEPILPNVPEPTYRHASPSGPWPWLNLDTELQAELDAPAQQEPLTCDHLDGECICWKSYPENLYPNWTARRVRESKIKDIKLEPLEQCVIYHVNVWNNGSFSDPGKYVVPVKESEFWKKLQDEVIHILAHLP